MFTFTKVSSVNKWLSEWSKEINDLITDMQHKHQVQYLLNLSKIGSVSVSNLKVGCYGNLSMKPTLYITIDFWYLIKHTPAHV